MPPRSPATVLSVFPFLDHPSASRHRRFATAAALLRAMLMGDD